MVKQATREHLVLMSGRELVDALESYTSFLRVPDQNLIEDSRACTNIR